MYQVQTSFIFTFIRVDKNSCTFCGLFRALPWNKFYWRYSVAKMNWMVDNIDSTELKGPGKTFIDLIIEPELSSHQF